MILLVFSAIGGGILTSTLLWGQSGALALALAPVGGSIAAACAAVYVGWRSGLQVASATNASLDEQIAALRTVAALGRRLTAEDAQREAKDERAA
jgi:hypothetical protein